MTLEPLRSVHVVHPVVVALHHCTCISWVWYGFAVDPDVLQFFKYTYNSVRDLQVHRRNRGANKLVQFSCNGDLLRVLRGLVEGVNWCIVDDSSSFRVVLSDCRALWDAVVPACKAESEQ